MKLRNRLTLFSVLTFGIVFIATALIIFFAFYRQASAITFKELKNTSLLSAIYYLEKDELSQYEHSAIKEQFQVTIQSSMVAVYNSANQVEFGQLYNDPNITTAHLERARQESSVSFKVDDFFYYGIYYPDNQGNFVVFAKQTNTEFRSLITSLLFIIAAVLIIGLLLIFILSKYLSNLAYKPLKQIVAQIKKVDYSNLEQAVATTNSQDEIDELLKTYNDLLARLSESFLVQKNFINYVSHEFKTPLTAIAGNLEVFAQRERTPQEYQTVAQEALKNVYQIEDLLSNLLLMSGLKKDSQNTANFRIDELLWTIYDLLDHKIQEQQTNLEIAIEVKDFKLLQQSGNETLVQLALFNLIENAVKYSEGNPVFIKLYEVDGQLLLSIQDQGIGISEEDLKCIDQTFYRGKNTGVIQGSGIGLALVKIILQQHQIKHSITSTLGKGTTILLEF